MSDIILNQQLSSNQQLTPNQQEVFNQLQLLLPHYPILILHGDAGTGKHTIINHFNSLLHPTIIQFNLLTLISTINTKLTAQDVATYLMQLISELIASTPKDYGVLYIRDFSYITDVLNDCYAQHRYLLPYILKTITHSLPANIKIIITSRSRLIPDLDHMSITLINDLADIKVLSQYLNLDAEMQTAVNKLCKNITIGKFLYCCRSASNMEEYIKQWNKFSPTNIDPQFDVPECSSEKDLIGLDTIMHQINISVINPLRLNLDGLTMKKGILLAGPPGTGKTSIGRWLAHNINGKFYLIGAEVGASILEKLEYCLRKAAENAPAVVFVDDCDMIFTRDEVYRGFLTLLDGVDSKKRHQVCVILTCMNHKTIPVSLLRGGRIELVLTTELPNQDSIRHLLDRGLHHIHSCLTSYNSDIAVAVQEQISTLNLVDWSNKFIGWNCADINRCLEDVCRDLIYNNSSDIVTALTRAIAVIKRQYRLCGNGNNEERLDYFI